jgi:murein DD-endopeptidase MepM/ murein hydrolase activator NlpD
MNEIVNEMGKRPIGRSRRWRAARHWPAVVLATVAWWSLPGPPAGAVACGWRAPVDAPVVDPFRQPEHRYGPGNRGLEYGAADGREVTAVAAGRVTFAGPVGGRRYVVVDHGAAGQGALRSTYGPLASVSVVRGQRVDAGGEVGTAASGFHLTARLGTRYVDPAPLLGGACARVRLVGPADRRATAPVRQVR